MVEERTCDFTGEPIEPGTGIMYVRADGTVLHFVDSKAEKNYFKGREARDLEWTEVNRRQRRERAEDEDTASEATPDEEGEAEDTDAADGESGDGADEDIDAPDADDKEEGAADVEGAEASR